MSRPTARVLALLELLQAGGRHTVSALAERLDVDERTLRRYAAHLVELGIPIDVTRGRYGGYRLAPGFKLPPLMLTDDEAVAVMLGLSASPSTPATESAAAKVHRVLPKQLADRIDALVSTMDSTAPVRRAVAPATDVLLALADAARRQRSVTLAYTAFRGRQSVRGFDPYGLVLHSGRWYVTGWDHESRELRTFRLDRVRSAVARAETFTPPADFDPVAQVLAGLAAVPWTHAVSVILHTDVETARRRIPVSVGAVEEVPGGVRLTLRVERLSGAADMLAGLGWPFVVEEPAELRDEVRAVAHRLLASA